MRSMRNYDPWSVARVFIIIAALFVVLMPLTWVFLASLKTSAQINDPFLLAFSPTLDNWTKSCSGGYF